MKNWLHFEILRYRQSRMFWLLWLGFTLCLWLVSTVGGQMYLTFSAESSLLAGLTDAKIPAQIFYRFFQYFEMVLSFFIVNRISEEQQLGTLKQHVMDGLSREMVWGSRIVLVLIVSIMAHLLFHGALVLLEMKMGLGAFSGWESTLFAGAFVRTLGLLSFVTLVATFYPRVIPCLAFIAMWVTFLEPSIGFFGSLYWKWPEVSFLPLDSFSAFVPEMQLFSSPEIADPTPVVGFFWLFPLLYFVLFWSGIYYKLKTADF